MPEFDVIPGDCSVTLGALQARLDAAFPQLQYELTYSTNASELEDEALELFALAPKDAAYYLPFIMKCMLLRGYSCEDCAMFFILDFLDIPGANRPRFPGHLECITTTQASVIHEWLLYFRKDPDVEQEVSAKLASCLSYWGRRADASS